MNENNENNKTSINDQYKKYEMRIVTMTAIIRGNISFDKDLLMRSEYYKKETNIDKTNNDKTNNDKKKFYNCESIYFEIQESQNICIKIFKNGTVQITGLKAIEHAYVIRDLIDKSLVVSINMINCCLKTGIKYNLLSLKDIFNNSDKFMAIYQPTRYHGLKVRHNNGTKMLIYGTSSGSMCIVANSFDKINSSLDDFFGIINESSL